MVCEKGGYHDKIVIRIPNLVPAECIQVLICPGWTLQAQTLLYVPSRSDMRIEQISTRPLILPCSTRLSKGDSRQIYLVRLQLILRGKLVIAYKMNVPMLLLLRLMEQGLQHLAHISPPGHAINPELQESGNVG